MTRYEGPHARSEAEIKALIEGHLSDSGLLDLSGQYLGNNRFEGQNIDSITEHFPENVTNLKLRHNNLNAESIQKITYMLATNKTVTEVDFAYNAFGDEGIEQITDMLAQNKAITKVDFSYTDRITSEGAGYIDELQKQRPNLAIVSKQNEDLIRPKDDSKVEKMSDERKKELDALMQDEKNFSVRSIKGEALRGEPEHKVKTLALQNRNLTDSDMLYILENMPNDVRGLEFYSNKNITDLTVNRSFITNAGLLDFVKANKVVTSLDVSNNYIDANVVPELVTALKQNPTLTEIKLDGNEIGESGRQQIEAQLEKNKNQAAQQAQGDDTTRPSPRAQMPGVLAIKHDDVGADALQKMEFKRIEGWEKQVTQASQGGDNNKSAAK
jgi:hypothetical protein